MINVYSNEHHSALKYPKDTKVNLQNILIIASNFNIKSNDWDLLYFFHSIYSDTLLKIVNSFDLSLSSPIQQVPVMECFDTNISFSFYLFFLILYFFSFEFLFPFSDEEEACDIAVT